MPRRKLKPCNYPSCPELVMVGTGYCGEHAKQYESKRNKVYDNKQRDKKRADFYNSLAWRRLSKAYLNNEPLCEHCQAQGIITGATEVDHIVAVADDWSKRFKIDNLQSLCHSCHMIKTVEDRKKYKE